MSKPFLLLLIFTLSMAFVAQSILIKDYEKLNTRLQNSLDECMEVKKLPLKIKPLRREPMRIKPKVPYCPIKPRKVTPKTPDFILKKPLTNPWTT